MRAQGIGGGDWTYEVLLVEDVMIITSCEGE